VMTLVLSYTFQFYFYMLILSTCWWYYLCQVWCEYQCLVVLYISKYIGAFDRDMLFRLV
jgi:hypothetical protein